MGKLIKMFSSSIGKKLIMCLTGLFLCIFLIVHFLGNLLLFKNDAGQSFNDYAYFLTNFLPITIISYILYLTIIAHVVWALILTIGNSKARPVKYARFKGAANSTWSSRNMGILGTVILIFIVSHMQMFWYEYMWGNTPYVEYIEDFRTGIIKINELSSINDVSSVGVNFKERGYVKFTDNGIGITIEKDLYKIAETAFQQWWIVVFYVIAMAALSFHLVHGFKSAFQTLGWDNKRYLPLIRFIALWVFGVLIPLGFAAMPVYFFIFK